MKYIPMMLAALAALFTTPALAQSNPNSNFVGPRIEATVGVDDVTNGIRTENFNYGAGIGVDLPLGDRATIGVEATVRNVFEYRDVSAAARLGVAVNEHVLPYVAVGYENLRGLDGLRVGGGVEIALNNHLYTKAEYRYTDFEQGQGRHAGLIGIGLRF